MAEQHRRREQPEDYGVPDYADDTTTAFNESDLPRFEDPAAMPDDRPLALDDFGLTEEEIQTGEPLEDRLAREQPTLDDPWAELDEEEWPEADDDLADEAYAEQAGVWADPDADTIGFSLEPDPDDLPLDASAAADALRGLEELDEDEPT